MGIVHFLNVGEGDCSIIQHPSGHVTLIDVSMARLDVAKAVAEAIVKAIMVPAGGNYRQKDYPENPIQYMRDRGITDVFRFILSHPDMDHMDGIKDFFAAFPPTNFWDTDNRCEKTDWNGGPYRREDWEFYCALRDGRMPNAPRRLVLQSGAREKYFNVGEDGSSGGDGLFILAPSAELAADAILFDDYNDGSYVILYRSNAGRILFCGDSHDATWEHILAAHRADVTDVDVLMAPHHGRKSDRSYDFLDIVNPRLTLFGNANSEHLAYDAWRYRELPVITNNQAGSIVIDTNGAQMEIYVTNQVYARDVNQGTFYSQKHRAWYIGQPIARPAKRRTTLANQLGWI